MTRDFKLGVVSLAVALILVEGTAGADSIGPRAGAHPLFAALRDGVGTAIQMLTSAGHDVNIVNADGETPLMYAALYSDAAVVARLLERRADPNAKTPGGTTALMLATGDLMKVKLLVERGANVNAQSATGRTPLLIAASRAGGGKVVEYLLSQGAAPNAKDNLKGIPAVPAGAGGSTPLIEAAKIRDGQALRALIAAGADIQAKDNSGADALAAAALNGNVENVRLLLARGARVDARVTIAHFTPLMFAAWGQDAEIARLLIGSGADVNAQDEGGATPLMWSAYSDYAETPTTEVLLAAKPNINHRNKAGETALDWARRRGETPLVKLLEKNGATGADRTAAAPEAVFANTAPPTPGMAAEKSIALLQKSSSQFYKVSGCVSCHNQSLPQMTIAMARARNIHVNEQAADQQRKSVLSVVRPARQPLMEMADVVPDVAGSAGYLMLGMAADNQRSDASTDPLVLNLAAKQLADGSWRPFPVRPPLEFSPVTSTALSIRVLQLYAPPARRGEMDRRVASARHWLRNVYPRTTEEKAMRLLGLSWAKAPRTEIERAAKDLADDQRADGGWAQLPALSSDAYATGQATYALRIAGGAKSTDPAYQRSAAYLLGSQHEDGSWHVASRSFPLQPYKESGFPHGKDQWISAAGTSWAAMALMLGAEEAR